MTTHSDTGQDRAVLVRQDRAAEISAAVNARDEAWAAVPGYSRYEWSDKGRARRARLTAAG